MHVELRMPLPAGHNFRFPPEIFIRCFEFTDQSSDSASYHTAIRLSQVCRKWRQIVQTTPSLWVNLVLSEAKHEESYQARLIYNLDQVERDATALSMYLTRSMGLPLRLVILQDYGTEGNGGNKPPGYIQAVKTSLIPAIVSFIRRCEFLTIRAFVHRRSLLLNNSTPESKSILNAFNESKSLKSLVFVATMHVGPRLRYELPGTIDSLIISSIVLSFGSSQPPKELRIRDLKISRGDSWLKFARIASQFTYLETLRLDVCQDFLIDASKEILTISDALDLPVQTVPKLRYLYLTLSTNHVLRNMNDNSSTWTLLDFLDLPSLIELHFDFDQGDAPPAAATSRIQTFFRRCPLLERLSFFGPLDASVLIGFLQAASRVERLIVAEPFEGDGFEVLLDALSESETNSSNESSSSQVVESRECALDINAHPRLCPHLRHITFPDVLSLPIESMAKFCIARHGEYKRVHASRQGSDSYITSVIAERGDSRLEHRRESSGQKSLLEANFFVEVPLDYLQDSSIRRCCESGFRLTVNQDVLSD